MSPLFTEGIEKEKNLLVFSTLVDKIVSDLFKYGYSLQNILIIRSDLSEHCRNNIVSLAVTTFSLTKTLTGSCGARPCLSNVHTYWTSPLRGSCHASSDRNTGYGYGPSRSPRTGARAEGKNSLWNGDDKSFKIFAIFYQVLLLYNVQQ